jgi:hypothetical protein
MQRPANPGIDPVVFWIAAVLSAAFVAWGILGTESLAAVFDAVLWSFLVPNFGWVFILIGLCFSILKALRAEGVPGRSPSSPGRRNLAGLCPVPAGPPPRSRCPRKAPRAENDAPTSGASAPIRAVV